MADCPPSRRHIVLAGAIVAVVYLAGVTNCWWPTPDSALYLGLGNSLAAGGGFRFNGEPNTTGSPGLPVILAGLRIAFGESYWPANLLMALCGLSAILFVFLTVERLSDRRTGMVVAIATAGSYTFFRDSHLILTDAPATALFWAVFYACVRARGGHGWWLALAAVLTPVLVAVRIPALPVLGCLALGLVLDKTRKVCARRRLLLGAGIAALMAVTALALYVAARSAGGKAPAYVNVILECVEVRKLPRRLDQMPGGLVAFANALSEMLTSQENVWPVSLVALAACGYGLGGLWRRGQRFVAPPIVIYPLFLAFLSPKAVRPRYLMQIYPLLLYVMIQGLCLAFSQLRRPRGKELRPVYFVRITTVTAAVIVCSNMPKVLRNAGYYSYLSHTNRYYTVVRGGRFDRFFRLADAIDAHCPDDAVIAANWSDVSIFHYLTGRRFVPLKGVYWVGPRVAVEVLRKRFLGRSDTRFLLVDLDLHKLLATSRIRSVLEGPGALRLLWQSKQYLLYQRREPVTATAETSESPGT